MGEFFGLVSEVTMCVLLFHLYHPGLTLLANIVSFVLMAWDKRKAQKKQWRLEESLLLLPVLLGGIGGLLAGMWYFRHKTRKIGFQMKICAFVIVWSVVIVLGPGC
eukprot:GFUD01003075.1.p1 GENE.GFUD01003075.1~~GFUD01003075.1.p1  ORF type:complete len:106 (+),score=5.34 GFUD01003075.1:42-359(+)